MKREQIISSIVSTLKKYKVPKAYLFGSFARKEKKYHDVDIAIEVPPGKFSLLDLIGLEQDIESTIGKKADVITIRSMNPRLKPYIEKDLVLLYA